MEPNTLRGRLLSRRRFESRVEDSKNVNSLQEISKGGGKSETASDEKQREKGVGKQKPQGKENLPRARCRFETYVSGAAKVKDCRKSHATKNSMEPSTSVCKYQKNHRLGSLRKGKTAQNPEFPVRKRKR